MGGTTKVDVGIRRVWVFLNSYDANNFATGMNLASIISTFIPADLVSKIVGACAGIAGVLVSSANHGNGVIIKIPHPIGIMLLGTPEICSQ